MLPRLITFTFNYSKDGALPVQVTLDEKTNCFEVGFYRYVKVLPHVFNIYHEAMQ